MTKRTFVRVALVAVVVALSLLIFNRWHRLIGDSPIRIADGSMLRDPAPYIIVEDPSGTPSNSSIVGHLKPVIYLYVNDTLNRTACTGSALCVITVNYTQAGTPYAISATSPLLGTPWGMIIRFPQQLDSHASLPGARITSVTVGNDSTDLCPSKPCKVSLCLSSCTP